MRGATLLLLLAASVWAQDAPTTTAARSEPPSSSSEIPAPQATPEGSGSSAAVTAEASGTPPPASSSETPAAEETNASATESSASDAQPSPSGNFNSNSTVDSSTSDTGNSTAAASGAATATEAAVPTSFTPQSVPVDTAPAAIVTTAVLTITPGSGPIEIPGLGDGVGASVDKAAITFPTSSDYWVLQGQDVLQWEPAIGVPVRIRLINDDKDLMPYPYDMGVNVPPSFTSMSLSAMEPAKAGSGFKLVLMDMVNSTVYAQSEEFEIKKEGTNVVFPAGYVSPEGSSGGGMAKASSNSAAAPTLRWNAGALFLAAIVHALL